MEQIEITLDLENEKKTGLKDRHIDKNKGNFKHLTSNQYKLLPFNTKWETSFTHEFIYFQWYFRRKHIEGNLGKELPKELTTDIDYDLNLKNKIIKKASSLVEKEDEETKVKLEQLISDMFFDGNNLFCFDKKTLPYLSFKVSNSTLKQIGNFIHEIFLNKENFLNEESPNNSNILYQLIKDSLPPLKDKSSELFGYKVWNKNIIELFTKDYNFLKSQERDFLKHIGLLLKFYYFIYVSKIALNLEDFYHEKEHPLFFLLETEVVSKNREGFRSGWNMLEKKLTPLFTHINTLELLNYIKVNNIPVWKLQRNQTKMG